MKLLNLPKCFCALASLVLFAVPAFGQNVPSASTQPSSASARSAPAKSEATVSVASLLARYPAGSIVSVEQADHALTDVQKGRAGIEARFKAEEQACYKTFLANKCVAEAKDRRRIALAEIKPIQTQADQFKRHAAVKKRDKALEEKRNKETGIVRPEPGVDARAQKFEAKHQQAEKAEQLNQAKRAENEAAFQKKTHDREVEQAKVKEKKAKTESRRKKKAASAAAAAAKQPPASSASASSSGS